jgi:RNA polymerase sigma-70 factor (ECF subfamily)
MAESTSSAATSSPIDWDASFAEHFGWLRSVVAARLGEPQAVDDVMQEVAKAAVASNQRAPLADPAKLAPWLYRIAVRQALLYRRSCGRRRKLVRNFAEQAAPQEADRTPDPLGWMLAQERSARFRAAMDDMPDRDREVLMLKYEHSWSYRRIAEQLDISMSAVETRLHRARRRLRKKLTQLEVMQKKKT